MSENTFGKIHVYTGDGKGKTTAALGLAIRALGNNKKIAIIYFDKGGDFYNERKVLDQLIGNNFQYFVTGQQRFDPLKKVFRFGVEAEDKAEALRGLNIIERLFNEATVDLLILDEINPAIHLGLVELEMFLKILEKRPSQIELILTGRNATPQVLAKADLITEMKEVKHYFNEGLKAREGIEY
ncbi:cob(I)yrinic acid a,c-diamide adenosyltransferase [Patescibacteria group bacterium]|nr:cob(I)yrinic acid a,c-diamide adenosyltransferase [Patescibacteria group bacterium]